MHYELTEHAAIRCQQRGIRPALIDLVVRFGKKVYVDQGRVMRRIEGKGHERIARILGGEAAEACNRLIVVTAGECVVTAWRGDRRIRR